MKGAHGREWGRLQDECLATVKQWMDDATISANATACVIAALVYAGEGNISDALRACHAGNTLEMCELPAPS